MKTQFFAPRPTLEHPLPSPASTSTPFEPTSLHRMIDQLLSGLQPLAHRQGNVLINGIPEDLLIPAEENMLAYVLGSLLHFAVGGKRNECIHIVAVTAADRTIICVKDVGTYYYHTISADYRKIQHAAEKLGGTISIDNEGVQGTHVNFSIARQIQAA